MGSYVVITYEEINMNFRFIKQTVLILLLLPTMLFASEVDLSLEVTSPQGEQTIGTTVPFYFQITNNSNTTATNVVFENDYNSNQYIDNYFYANGPYYRVTGLNDSNFDFVSAESSQGNCSLEEFKIKCNIGTISFNETVDITINMKTEYIGDLNMFASIISDQIDINKANNSKNAMVSVSSNGVNIYAAKLEFNLPNSNQRDTEKGNYRPRLSADGKLVSFMSTSAPAIGAILNYRNVYMVNLETKEISVPSLPNNFPMDLQIANNQSYEQEMSRDGDLIVFYSKANNIVDNDANNKYDVFLHRRSTKETHRVSISNYGLEGNYSSYSPDISADGKYVTFHSRSSNLVIDDENNYGNIFIYDITNKNLSKINLRNSALEGMNAVFPSISGDGTKIVFRGDGIKLWDKSTQQVKTIPLHDAVPEGREQNFARKIEISDNGKYLAYKLDYNVYLYDIDSDKTSIISRGYTYELPNGTSSMPSISADGRYIVYSSIASDIVDGDTNDYTDVFVYDSVNKTTKMVSMGVGGFQAKNHCIFPTISADGSTIAFQSLAHNLVPNDTNEVYDIFIANNPFLTEEIKQVDLSIEKTASASEIEIGKNITYTLTVDNISVNTEATATGVTIEDILPTGLTFDSITHPDNVTCSEDSGTVSCDLGDIAVSDPSISIEIVGKTTAKGEIKNTATVTASETDSDTSNNSSEATITVIELTDVYINGSIDDSVTYYIGDELTYSFEVGNNSANPATDVTAIITLPTAFSSITASTDIDNSTCSVNDTKITCIFGDDIEQTDKANIIVKATPSAAGDFDVDAQVTTAKTDSDNDNNSDTATVAVKPKSDLAISIEDSDDPDGFIYAGTNLTYTITVKNNGPSDATNVKIKDTLPTGVTFVSANSSCAQAAGEVICNIDDIANGASKSVNVVIKPTTPGTITNEVTVSATEHDHVETNNSKSEDTLVKAVADLQITSVSASPIPPSLVLTGNELTYTFKIKNNGINGATEVLLKDTLPDGMTFVPAGSSPDCTEAAGEVTCNIGDLANGADLDINIVVKPTKPGIFTNKATTSAKEHDPVDNNEKSIDVDVKAVTDMELVSASATPNPVYAGANLTYDVTIRNNAAEFNTATGIKVTYTFYDNIILDSASSCTAVGNVVTCFVNDMVYNTTKDIQLVIQPDMDGDLEADIEVISITHDPDTSEDSNSKSITTAVTPAVDIVVTMLESADPILVGQDLTYTITVKNNGPSTAINVVLQDILPAAAPVQSFVTSQGTCINNLTTFDCDIGDLANDDSVKITLVIRPTNGAAGTLINEATVSSDVYERPTTPDNNVASASTTVNQSSKLKVSLKGKGSGSVTGTGISCPEDCEEVFTRGDKVILTASPISSFDRWQGGVCSGKNNICEFTLDKPNMNVMASFK